MSLHKCEGWLPRCGCGPAIDECVEREDGSLWIDNGEYGSQVAFCPCCGFKAKVAPEVGVPTVAEAVVPTKEQEEKFQGFVEQFKKYGLATAPKFGPQPGQHQGAQMTLTEAMKLANDEMALDPQNYNCVVWARRVKELVPTVKVYTHNMSPKHGHDYVFDPETEKCYDADCHGGVDSAEELPPVKNFALRRDSDEVEFGGSDNWFRPRQ